LESKKKAVKNNSEIGHFASIFGRKKTPIFSQKPAKKRQNPTNKPPFSQKNTKKITFFIYKKAQTHASRDAFFMSSGANFPGPAISRIAVVTYFRGHFSPFLLKKMDFSAFFDQKMVFLDRKMVFLDIICEFLKRIRRFLVQKCVFLSEN
jgi:hypothetical protein